MAMKTFRTAKSTSKYTAKYCVSYHIDNQPSRVIFLESLRKVRALVAQLKEQGYSEEKTSLSLTL
jgi:hypothetical protein